MASVEAAVRISPEEQVAASTHRIELGEATNAPLSVTSPSSEGVTSTIKPLGTTPRSQAGDSIAASAWPSDAQATGSDSNSDSAADDTSQDEAATDDASNDSNSDSVTDNTSNDDAATGSSPTDLALAANSPSVSTGVSAVANEATQDWLEAVADQTTDAVANPSDVLESPDESSQLASPQAELDAETPTPTNTPSTPESVHKSSPPPPQPRSDNVHASVDAAERRLGERKNLELSLYSDSNFYVGLSENISVNGVFVATHQLSKRGALIDLTITLPTDEQIVAHGVVRWIREFNEASDTPPGMGIEFLRVDGQELISAFLAARPPLFHDE